MESNNDTILEAIMRLNEGGEQIDRGILTMLSGASLEEVNLFLKEQVQKDAMCLNRSAGRGPDGNCDTYSVIGEVVA